MIPKAPITFNNMTVQASSTYTRVVTIDDIAIWPLGAYIDNLGKLWLYNRPTFVGFLFNPGFVVVLLFWGMYLSSLIYYSGRDDLKRYHMTKAQNRDDLAELKDDKAQNVYQVIRDLIVRDFLAANGKYIEKESRRKKAPNIAGRKQLQPPQVRIYEDMTKVEKKKYKKRARRKVFGLPAGLCDRARRYYHMTLKHNDVNPNAKMSFFNEELKNNLWIGLIAKTSKIAPRHVRLAVMYMYASLYILFLTIIFSFNL